MKVTINLNYGLLTFFCMIPFTSFAAEYINNTYLNQQILPTPQDIRDPFTPSDLMFNVASKTSGISANGFMRSPIDSVIPRMRLRGFIDQDKKEPIALLEVAGARTYLVREGDDININPSLPNSVIRITKITRNSITVETGSILGSIRVQR